MTQNTFELYQKLKELEEELIVLLDIYVETPEQFEVYYNAAMSVGLLRVFLEDVDSGVGNEYF